MKFLEPGFLFASMIWGSIGAGYFLYGKKRQSLVSLLAGVGMIAISYLADSIWMMSAICVVLMAAVYKWH